MHFLLGCNHPSFTLPWRTLLPYLVALHLLQPGSAQQRVVAPSLRVTANVGQDVVLRCHLSPCMDVRNSDIRWIQQRSSGIVHHYQDGVDLGQMEEYKGRTELLRDGLSDGNLDLRITAVTSSDSGSYICGVKNGDAYAEAVVNLEVSDPFSMIILYWTVALAVVITILVGSSVMNVFLYRKKVAQSRELKRKDAELVEKAAALEGNDAALAELPVILGLSAANLKILASKLMKQMEKLDIRNSLLKKQYEKTEILAEQLEKHCNEMDLSAADLKKQIAELVEQREGVEEWHIQLRKHYEKLGSRAANLKTQLKKLENKIEEVGESSSLNQRNLGSSQGTIYGLKRPLSPCTDFLFLSQRNTLKRLVDVLLI